MKYSYDSKVEAIQSRVDVVYFSQRTTGNWKIRVGLNVGCSIQCQNGRKKGRLTQSQQQIWNLEKTVPCLSLSNTNATEMSYEIAWVRIWGTRNKECFAANLDSISTEIPTRTVSLLCSTLHREQSQYTDNRYETYVTALQKNYFHTWPFTNLLQPGSSSE